MKRVLIAGVALALLVPACASAQSVFDGTWKLDAATLHVSHARLETVSLKNGVWRCERCGGADSTITVKADGADHPVTGQSGYNTVAIKVVNDQTVKETDKMDGKVVGTMLGTAAADGKTATIQFTDDTGLKPASGTVVLDRVGEPVPGENAIAGGWTFGHYTSLSDPSTILTLKFVGDRVTVSNAAGESYSAVIGGPAVPYRRHGRPDGTVAMTRVGTRGLRATFEKHGKVTATNTVTVATNGKSLQMTIHNLRTGTTSTMIHDKVS